MVFAHFTWRTFDCLWRMYVSWGALLCIYLFGISFTSLWCIYFQKQGAMAHSWVHCQRSYSCIGRISRLIIVTYLLSRWIYMVINKCLVGLLVFCFKLLVCTYKRTSSFMTSALDAIVFVKVCNLWWVSDKVPRGRGVAPVQLLSRKTPDFMTRMSNLQTLIGNSSKFLSLGSRFLPAIFSVLRFILSFLAMASERHLSSWCSFLLLLSTYLGMFGRACLKMVAVLKNLSSSELCRYRQFRFAVTC